MKRLGALALATSLFGCAGPGDGCEAIIDVVPLPAAEAESIALWNDPEWRRGKAEACIHRSAYRLARGGDDAAVIAPAVSAKCQDDIANAVSLASLQPNDLFGSIWPSEFGLAERRNRSKAYYQDFALLKVVEGRAGNCRG